MKTMKQIGQVLRSGFSSVATYWRVLVPFYLITLLLAGLSALPWRALVQSQAGHSLLLGDLLKGFDYTFLNDFLQNYETGLTPLLNLSLLTLVVYLFAMVFLTAGLVQLLLRGTGRHDRTVFWGGGGQYCWRVLRLTAFFLLLHLLVLVLFGWLYLTVIKGGSPAKLDNEGIITASFRWIIPLYVAVAAFFFCWQDHAKVQLLRGQHRWIWPAVGQSLRSLVQNFGSYYGTYLANMLLLAALFGVNHLLGMTFERASSSGIMLSFLLTQLFVLGRYALKIVNLGSVVSLNQGR